MNVKQDFPIFKNYPDLVYLDSAATTQKPQAVIDRIVRFYEKENANVHRGIYKLSELATAEYEKSREEVARFINASKEEIIFTSGVTESINAIASWFFDKLSEGDTILSTQLEHHSSFLPLQQLMIKKNDALGQFINLQIIKLNENLEIDLDDLRQKLHNFKPKLVVLSHVSNTLGTIAPIKEIVAIKNEISPDTIIAVDAAQSIAHLPIDVKDLGIDLLGFSGHKLYAPTGIGVLWAKRDFLKNVSPYKYGGGAITTVTEEISEWKEGPEKFEGGTPNIEGAVGLAEAIRYLSQIGFENIVNHEKELSEYTFEKLKSLEKINLIGPFDLNKKLGVFSIEIPGIHPHDIAQILDESNICVRAGHHCTQILMKRVLNLPATTRISLGIYNSKQDIDRLIEGLQHVKTVFKI